MNSTPENELDIETEEITCYDEEDKYEILKKKKKKKKKK